MAYRVLADGTTLEIELSVEEWRSLMQKELAAENDAVCKLNEHPLNQVALVLLRRAGGQQYVGALEQIHLLSLARLALPDFDESAEGQDAWVRFSNWTRCASSMRAALVTIDHPLGRDGMLEMSPREAAECILNELGVLNA